MSTSKAYVTNNHQQILSATQFKQLISATSPYDVVEIIEQHFSCLMTNKGDWNHSIYDQAWLLCTDYFSATKKDELFNKLLDTLHDDGYWGNADYLPHSAVIDTLAVIMAFCQNDKAIPKVDFIVDALTQLLKQCMLYDHHDTVGFELLAPALVKWIDSKYLSLNFTSDITRYLERIHYKALAKINYLSQQGKLFSAANTLSYSLEAFVLLPQFRPKEIAPLLLNNGAVGLSPAATSAAILLIETTRENFLKPLLRRYIDQTRADYNYEALPNLHPISTSRRLWNILPFLLSDQIHYFLGNSSLKSILQTIYCDIKFNENGCVSWDIHNSDLPDLDDTAVAFTLFNILAENNLIHEPTMSINSFTYFHRDNQYVCYPHELHPSPASLLHTLKSLEWTEINQLMSSSIQSTEEMRSTIIRQLDPTKLSIDELGHDKWHATWTYGIQRWLSVNTIQKMYPKRITALVDEVLDRKQDDGWGQYKPTLEETSYVVSGLVAVLCSPTLNLTKNTQDRLHNALAEIVPVFKDCFANQQIDMPPIWISKNVYAPKYQIISAILSAWMGLVELGLND